MKVFRVEFGCSVARNAYDSEKIVWDPHMGPYQRRADDDTIQWLDEHGMSLEVCIYYDEDRHPSCMEDFRLSKNLYRRGTKLSDEDYFGFTSLQKLSKWFNKDDRYQLHHAGFICMVYEVENHFLLPGNKQCIFNLKKATPERFINLLEIY